MARSVSQITTMSVAFPSSSASLSIDSLDNRIRDELLRSSHTFFLWVLISAFVVAIGVLLEGPELLQELWPKLFRWFTWNSQERLHRFERKLKKVGLVGWLLVGIGVAGEGVFEVLQSRAESQLQTFNDVLLKDARLTATTARKSAGDAANAAHFAQVKADGADSLARATRLEADFFEMRIKSANDKAADAESHLAEAMRLASEAEKEAIRLHDIVGGWRLDDAAKARFTKDVKAFPGTPFDLAVNPAEASFMEELDALLTAPSAGWVRLPPKPDKTGMAILIDGKASIILSSGIVLEVDRDQVASLKPALTALITGLREELGLKTVTLHMVPSGSWGKRIHIIIGKRE